MKYNVIIVLDETRDRSYYYSYVPENGNIQCDELPPYADVNKAQACYWDGEKWIFDEEKYAEIVAEEEAAKEAEQQAELEAAATPTNAEIAQALMELGEDVSAMMDAITELAEQVAALKGGE